MPHFIDATSLDYLSIKPLVLNVSGKKEKTYINKILLKSGRYYETRDYKFPIVRGLTPTPKPRSDDPSPFRRSDSVHRARKSLVRKVLANAVSQKPLFFTFTYVTNMEDYERAVNDIKAFIQGMSEVYGKIKYVYVLERQKRGAWHVHMLIFDRNFLQIRAVRSIWQETIGEKARVHVVPTNNAKHCAFYFAKYMGKDYRPGNIRSYSCSKGLKKPVEIINYHERHDLVFPKECVYDRPVFTPTGNFIQVSVFYEDQRNLSWL